MDETPERVPLPLDDTTKIVIWVLCLGGVVLFALFAVVCTYIYQRKKPELINELEFFLTARNTQPTIRVAWSFVAGVLGAWILAGPPGYAVTAGVIGLIFYALASGLPVLLLAFVGDRIQKKLPNVISFCDYVHYRFGLVPQIYVVIIMLLNMGIGLTAEYTAVGDIFENVLGINRIPILVTVGVLTMVYTAYGGLYVSIITDQGQAIFASLLLIVLSIYVGATFRPELGPLPDFLQPTYTGFSSIAAMPISLFCATVYSEAPWQRIWASENPQALKTGAALASFIIFVFVFVFGLFGFLAAWAGYPTDDPNLLVFSLLAHGEKVAPSWIIVIMALLIITMNESAVDSFQNALVDTISTMVLRNRSVNWARGLVVLINIPIIIVSLQNYPVINLFLIGNVITSTSALPMLLGLWDGGYNIVTGASVVFGSLFSLISVMVYGIITMDGDANKGLNFVFFESYDYPTFLIATGFSLIGVALWVAAVKVIELLGIRTIYLPGFKPGYLNTTNDAFDNTDPLAINSHSHTPKSNDSRNH
ncbi:hypothetical protein K502DRAFT_342359 [Neoconidiobolus thromboides FSU 785]|nr:hypothetical protein K502DRAFT_342359 [Neoconidiobolus thromboides FSU 785]